MKDFMTYITRAMLLVLFVLPTNAFAYIDPGTGSLLASIVFSIFATFLFFIKGLIYKVKFAYYSLQGKRFLKKSQGIVFYSDGKQYWNVFEPIIAELVARNEPCTYLCSDENDLGLQYSAPNFVSHNIGRGNQAYAQLNMLEADICVMTTPGLDVYQLRRSSGVKHYAHVVHMPGEVSLYRRFGLDYYDTVLTSGLHQEESIRCLEAQRNIKTKTILQSGCPYYDILLRKKEELSHAPQANTLLIAPTWGVNGLLRRYGMELLRPLMEKGYSIIIRPHPQSFIAEPELMAQLQEATSSYAHVQWDTSADNFAALSKAQVLISDYSSIIYDFAFVFERPVVTLAFEPDLLPYDAYHISKKPWNFSGLTKIGAQVDIENLSDIHEIIQTLTSDTLFVQKIRDFREASVYNFGNSGKVIVDQLLEIKKSLD